MSRLCGLTIVAALLGLYGFCAWPGDALNLIPVPAHVDPGIGEWVMPPDLTVVYERDEAFQAALFLSEALEAGCKVRASHVPGDAVIARGIFITTRSAAPELGSEGYELGVSAPGVTIRAHSGAGAFYGVQTLLQLLLSPDAAKNAPMTMPCMYIKDFPRFSWRGLMLDCSRTFLSLDYLRRYVDRLAFYKLNVLHLHLTDDQGWRMEIKKHPRLTEVGARFDARLDGEISGYYTQDELRDLVAYAAARNVTIVPEIEMPSHCLAALTAYPELSCRGDAYTVVPFTYPNHPIPEVPAPPYGVFCAGNERVFEMLEDVLAEVVEVFPCKYIHIGGDECPKDYWKTCPKCQARMVSEGLANEEELQSYFIKRIERYVNARGRVLLGWDEILEGGLAPNATVMAWRGVQGGIEAAKAGHDVVMSPTTHCYFDYDYMTTPLKKVYEYEPIPAELSSEDAARVLGAQGNMWTHLARTEATIDAQIFPRLTALSEVTWSPKEKRDWDDFQRRMTVHYALLKSMGAAYYVERPVPELTVAPDGTPWAIVNTHIYAFIDGAWQPQPGALRALAFAADGRRFALAAEEAPGGSTLLRWEKDAWVVVDGNAAGVSLGVASDGTLWLVGEDGSIRTCVDGAWSNVPGKVSRIVPGPKGECYALGVLEVAGGHEILRWTGADWSIVSPGAAAIGLTVSPDGTLWAVNCHGVIWFRTQNEWTAYPGLAGAIGIGGDGVLYALSLDPANQSWTLMKPQSRVKLRGGTAPERLRPVQGGALPRD